MRELLSKKNVKVSESQLEEEMAALDVDGNGTIELSEFLRWWGEQSVESEQDMKMAELGQLHADVQSEFDTLARESTGACGYNRPCAHQYIGKSQSCMVDNGRLIPHAPYSRGGGCFLHCSTEAVGRDRCRPLGLA